MLKKTIQLISYIAFLLLTVLLLLEVSFRFYMIDFYRGNLIGLNKDISLKPSDQSTILVMGDSFTATQKSYVNDLRKALPNNRFINSAIPGTCVKQHAIMASSRIEEFEPDLFLYQIYLGNDLLEFHHPIKRPSISLLRKSYWWLADRLLVLGYLNTRLSHLKPKGVQSFSSGIDAKLLPAYSKERYNNRSKLNFKADPFLIENSILLKEEQKKDMIAFCDELDGIIDQLPKNCKIAFLIMPHCMQLNDKYANRMLEIGAQISDQNAIQEIDYPFIKYLEKRFPPNRVLMINPLSILKEKDVFSPVYYDNDPHLNEVGQGIIGAYLLEVFNSQKSK